MCLDEMYGGNATAYLSANPMQHLTGSPVCGECLDEFVHDIQNAHDGPMATMNQMLPPQQIPVLVGCLCEHSEELDADPQRAAPRILFGCVMRVGSNVALPPASRQQAEAAALALFDRSEPTAEASPSLNITPNTALLAVAAVLFVVAVVFKLIRFVKNCRTICCPADAKPTGKTTAMM